MQVQRSGTQRGDARRCFLHSRGAQVYRYAPALLRAKGRGVRFVPRAYARDYNNAAPSGLPLVIPTQRANATDYLI
ncbi:MAG: hypothetical protein LBD87_02185 [Prevotellaceae bacterium]|nr:hypothetical protein [Prevotellaceae bacterium]